MEIFNQPDPSILDQYNNRIPPFSSAEQTTTLDNGQTINHPWYLTGGGDIYYLSFINAIRKVGKQKYNTTFEWCFGHGRIGWEILTRGICDQLVFNDCYDLAIETGLKNAEKLGYKKLVRGYHTPSILNIPKYERFDLIIGNPPHSSDKEVWISEQKKINQSQEMIDVSLRLTVDHEWKIHEDFFKYIANYLADDGDIFINNHSTALERIVKMSKSYGFVLLHNFDKDDFGEDQFPVLHFKKS